jgi:hypothetical protein
VDKTSDLAISPDRKFAPEVFAGIEYPVPNPIKTLSGVHKRYIPALGELLCGEDRDMGSHIFRAVDLWAYCRHPLLTARFYRALGYLPSIGLPDTYNEKILWRQIFDRNPLIGTLSDKLQSKQYVLKTCPGIKAAEVLWSGSRAEDIPPEVLQDNVVVKTNHGSGFNIFVQKVYLTARVSIGK